MKKTKKILRNSIVYIRLGNLFSIIDIFTPIFPSNKYRFHYKIPLVTKQKTRKILLIFNISFNGDWNKASCPERPRTR